MAIHKFLTSQTTAQWLTEMEPLKVWIVSLPEKKSRAFNCCFLLTGQVYSQKKIVVLFFAWSADKNGGSVARGKRSYSCSILFYLLESNDFCKHLFSNLFVINKLRFLGQIFLVRKRWGHETASSTRINGSLQIIHPAQNSAIVNC